MKLRCEDLLQEISTIPGIPGREEVVRKKISDYISPRADALETDAMGNLLAFKWGRSKSILLLSAHMDEVGFTVQRIGEDGTVYIVPVGYPETACLTGERVSFYGGECARTGGTLTGVVTSGLLSKYSRDPVSPKGVFQVTIGAESRREAEKAGIEIGTPVTFFPHFNRLIANRVAGKAFDNRAGVTALLWAFLNLEDSPSRSICAVFSAQEETGQRGAGTAVNRVEPAAAVCVDTATATFFKYPVDQETSLLGNGPVVSHQPATNHWLSRAVENTARKNSLPFQRQARGLPGADAHIMQMTGSGIPCAEVDIPVAYYHTASTMLSLMDLEITARLLHKLMTDLPLHNQTASP